MILGAFDQFVFIYFIILLINCEKHGGVASFELQKDNVLEVKSVVIVADIFCQTFIFLSLGSFVVIV